MKKETNKYAKGLFSGKNYEHFRNKEIKVGLDSVSSGIGHGMLVAR